MKSTLYVLSSLLCIIITINTFKFKETDYIAPLLLESDEEIKKVILELTPMGTSMEEVLKIIKENEEWSIDSISYEEGFFEYFPGGYKRIGEKYIRCILGVYENPSLTYVVVYWGFDKDSKFMFIYVLKDTDSL